MKYAYFPGCAADATTREAKAATKNLCNRLGIELEENKGFSCCGAGVLSEENFELELTINARNFALAEKDNRDILTICNTCLLTMSRAKKTLDEDKKWFEVVNDNLSKIGLEYTGRVRLTHLLWALKDDFGFDNLKKHIKRDLTGLKIAPFYGCHILRPDEILGRDSTELLDELIKALGAEPVQFKSRYDCCGFHIVMIAEKSAMKMTGKILDEIHDAKADCIVTPCTLCHINLDSYQPEALAAVGKNFDMPVLHLAQLIGLAVGVPRRELELDKHIVMSEKILTLSRATAEL
ncbi:MAG: CoB--CoM heterodisulfide reductase iron-sulfur subunit B family protein [Myxococcota bacterium]